MEFSTPESFEEYAQSTGRTYVSMTIQTDDDAAENLGTMLLELYTDLCPNTCENFVKVATAKGKDWKYAGSPIHRVVKHAYIQGGDVVDGTGKGDAGYKISDETFQVKHDDVGILAMANNGEPHTGSTQFFITLNPLPWLDGKRVAFGRVLTAEGLETLQRVGAVQTNNERPVPELVIASTELVYPKP